MDDHSYVSDYVSEIEEESGVIDGENSTSAYHPSPRDNSPRSFGDKSDDYSYSFDDEETSVGANKSRKSPTANRDPSSAVAAASSASQSADGGGIYKKHASPRQSMAKSSQQQSHPAPSYEEQRNAAPSLYLQQQQRGPPSMHRQIVLEEIGNEVLQLRDQQRNAVKMRLRMAREKKERAEARRRAYEDEKIALIKRAEEAELREKRANMQNDVLSQKVASLESNVRDLRSNLQRSMDNEDRLSKDVIASNRSVADLKREMTDEKAAHLKESKEWEEERLRLHLDVNEAETKQQVIQEAMEKAQTSFDTEKNSLPDHYKSLLTERLLAVQRREEELMSQEKRAAADLEREKAGIEESRRDIIESAVKNREVVDATLADERRAVQSRWKELENEREHQVTLHRRELAQLEAQRLDLSVREGAVQEKERDLDTRRQRLETELAQVEPRLATIREDLERARGERADADKVRQNVDEYAASLVEAEKGLRRREEAMGMAVDALERNKSILILQSRNLTALRKAQDVKQERINREHFKLHQSAVELSNQFAFLRGLLRRLRGHSSKNLVMAPFLNKSSSTDTSLVVRSESSSLAGDDEEGQETSGLVHQSQLTGITGQSSRPVPTAMGDAAALPHSVVVDMMSKVEGAYTQLTELITKISVLPVKENVVQSSVGNGDDADESINTSAAALNATLNALQDTSQRVTALSEQAKSTSSGLGLPVPPPRFNRAAYMSVDDTLGRAPNHTTKTGGDGGTGAKGEPGTGPRTSLELATESAKALKAAATRHGFF